MEVSEDRYRRVVAAVDALAELSVGPRGAGPAEVVAGDDMVLARMWAAAEVVRAAGMPVGSPAGAAELLSDAVGWQRYARGPVSVLHAACGADIARGLLRLWAHHRPQPADRPAARRAGLRQARIRLSSRVRAGCAALRAELRADAARVATGRAAAFRADVDRRAQRFAAEIRDAVEWELHGVGALPEPGRPADVDLPPPAATGLENRLTLLLGAGFGAGAALTLGRLWAQFLPGPAGLVAAVSTGVGLVLAGWVVRTRRMLVERAVLDRWVCEVTAALRSALDEHIAARLLAAETALACPEPVRRFGT